MNVKMTRMIMAMLLAALLACAPALADGTSLWSLGSVSDDNTAEDAGSKSSFFGGAPANQGSDDIETAPRETVVMPYEPLPGDDFWYDDEYARLDEYMGSELNLVLPREIGGTQLTMIGGSVMSRACGGDNFEAELPVRSLVIPETYTELAYWAFSDCEALETVICYAPLENLPDSVFSGCTSLREVVFVNGVRNIGGYVFDGCTSLETVYLGDAVESVSDTAFLNMDGSEAFAPDDCITDPALMPDVDALLEAVKSEPLAPAPAATTAPSAPTTATGDITLFVGTWLGDTLEMDGSEMSLSDFGIEMEMTINADGTAVYFDGEETVSSPWTMEGDALNIDGMTATITEDGRLSMDEDGSRVLFVRGEGAPIEPTDIDDTTAFVGTWHACYLCTGGLTGDLRETLGLYITLELNEDGSGVLNFGEPEEHSWYQDEESGIVYFGEGGDAADMPMALLDEGFLQYGNEAGGYIIFSQDAEAVWDPLVNQPIVIGGEAPSGGETPSGAHASERLERKYVCVNAEVSGYTVDASMLGGEYSLTFHADGTVDFAIAGQEIAGLSWKNGTVTTEDGEADAFVVDYYGSALNAVLTDEGFDMNYFDAMLMHFLPEE